MDADIAAVKKKSQVLLEKSWAKIESDFKPFNRKVSVAHNPISAFTYYLEMGKYPPPEIMVNVMEGFLNYFESHGDKSLDEALLGTKHTKYGSLSYKQEYFLRYSAFEWFIFEGEFTSLDAAAEEFLKPFDEEMDQDTFLRNYRRWKSKKKE
ncbi:MAG: hypothetical protein P8J32_05975 [bacterium]|nr:hypothetical protein [bacterium]